MTKWSFRRGSKVHLQLRMRQTQLVMSWIWVKPFHKMSYQRKFVVIIKTVQMYLIKINTWTASMSLTSMPQHLTSYNKHINLIKMMMKMTETRATTMPTMGTSPDKIWMKQQVISKKHNSWKRSRTVVRWPMNLKRIFRGTVMLKEHLRMSLISLMEQTYLTYWTKHKLIIEW